MKIFLLAVCFSLSASVANALDRQSLRLEVNYGEKVTIFEIQNPVKHIVIVDGREKKALPGNIKTVFKLANEAAKLKSNDQKLCQRKFIQLKLKSQKKTSVTTGCIGSKTPVASKLTDLANMMTLM